MDAMNGHGIGNLGSLMEDASVELRLWDMDPDTSTVRSLVRKRIKQLLSKQPPFRKWEHEHEHAEKIARCMDDMLLARAPSQVHYMNLATLESRLNDLINCHKNDVSFSSNGSTVHSYEIPHNMDWSSRDTSYHSASTLSSDCATASSDSVRISINDNSASSSLLAGCSTSSRCYLPNGHHRVAANTFAADVYEMHYPETIQQYFPVVSNNYADHGVLNVIPSNTDVELSNGHVLHDVGSNAHSSISQMPPSRLPDEHFNGTLLFAANTDPTIDGASLSEHCDNQVMTPYNFYLSPKLITPASSFGPSGNFRNLHQSEIHSHWKMMPVNAPSLCSAKEFFLQYNQSNHLPQKQKELDSQQQHLWVRNRILGFDQSQSTLNGSSQVKGCAVENRSYSQPDQLQLQQKKQNSLQQHLSLGNKRSGGTPAQRTANVTQKVVEKFQMMHSAAPQFCPSIEGSKKSLNFTSKGSATAGRFIKPSGDEQYGKYHTYRLLYDHAMCCTAPEKKCDDSYCKNMKDLLVHISNCGDSCSRRDCSKHKKLLAHFRECRASTCGICGPVSPNKMRLKTDLQATVSSDTTESLDSSLTANTIEHKQPPSKRTKIDNHFRFHKSQNETSMVSLSFEDPVHSVPVVNIVECEELNTPLNTTPESIELDAGPSSSSSYESHPEPECCAVDDGDPVMDIKMKLHVEPSTSLELIDAQPEKGNVHILVEADKVKLEGNCTDTATSDVHVMETKPRKPKKGVSLIDSFTPEEIREHIDSLRQPVDQSKKRTEETHGVGQVTDMNTCSLCGEKDLRFDPPARYCAQCYKKINHKGFCYSTRSIEIESDLHILFCRECFNQPAEENVKVGATGTSILKENLVRVKNYIESDIQDEWWVHCDKCKAWQHQICTLFNSTRNKALQVDHTCPSCILQEIESGEHKPLLQSKVLRAKDLPTTMLSDHIEKWIFRCLEEERQERANSLGKTSSEVPAAEGLVVRVLSSVDKKVEVKQVFRDIFQEETYPSGFPYKSKGIFLFQNIDGADVFLFGMYVQEYGSKCAEPNRRRINISYIDSVKYFRPKVKAVTGEALRTFVYHEILIGYLDYCKKRGFTSCHIWSCPPLKRDDDYILYCHPKIQKMPKTEKLREWYQTIVRKAAKKGIVAENTNLHDHFFLKSSECTSKVTAARLPYFDNDYWPGDVELFLESVNGSTPQKKGEKAMHGRVLRLMKRYALIENTKDILFMHQLGNSIRPMKEDFIIAHLWHVCKHCYHPILSGKQWICSVCKNFQLCEKCFLSEQNLEMKDRHPRDSSEKHSFRKVLMDNIPEDIIDHDVTVRSEIFDTRLIFLGHCQSNHYQFDTLRRAKHSTMMILHNLHNPFSPLVSACSDCHNDIGTAEGWHCLSCTGYDMCDSCYHNGAFKHEHELVRSPTVTDHTSQQSKQVQSLEELSGAPLSHASKCGFPSCSYPYCLKLKGFFYHSANCQTRANGGCVCCRKIWHILCLHAQSCGEPQCCVPRCKDLREYLRKKQLRVDSQQLLEDSRRRAGAKQRMKERIMRQKNSEALEAGD